MYWPSSWDESANVCFRVCSVDIFLKVWIKSCSLCFSNSIVLQLCIQTQPSFCPCLNVHSYCWNIFECQLNAKATRGYGFENPACCCLRSYSLYFWKPLLVKESPNTIRLFTPQRSFLSQWRLKTPLTFWSVKCTLRSLCPSLCCSDIFPFYSPYWLKVHYGTIIEIPLGLVTKNRTSVRQLWAHIQNSFSHSR